MRVYTEQQMQAKLASQKKCRDTDEYRAKRRVYDAVHRNTEEYKKKKSEYASLYYRSEAAIEKRKEQHKDLKARAKRMIATIRTRCRHSGKDLDLSEEWLYDKLSKGVCEASGIPFNFEVSGRLGFYTPSVDRIDNSEGYLMDNCRLVLMSFNTMKGTATDEDVSILVAALKENGF